MVEDRRRPARQARVGNDQRRDVFLVAGCRRLLDQLGEEIRRRRRPMPPITPSIALP